MKKQAKMTKADWLVLIALFIAFSMGYQLLAAFLYISWEVYGLARRVQLLEARGTENENKQHESGGVQKVQ